MSWPGIALLWIVGIAIWAGLIWDVRRTYRRWTKAVDLDQTGHDALRRELVNRLAEDLETKER